jgi:signal transduction histidine kinase
MAPSSRAPTQTILVVDDEASNRDVMRELLRAHHVLEAASGEQALELIASERVDLVLLDVQLPRMSGYDTCRRIKALQPEGFLPVILVTGLSERTDRTAGLEAGADDFLTKPVDGRELVLRVRLFLRLHAQDRLIRRQLKDLVLLQAAKEDLVSLIVHDVRSPLSGQLAILQLMLEDLGPGEAPSLRADLEKCLGASRQVLDLLEEVLRVRLLEEGALPIRREPVTLAPLLEGSLALLRGVARRQGIELTLQTLGDPSAALDERLVRRSIENLVSNAIKYSGSGREVSVTLRNHKGEVGVEVADRGPGIPPELRGILFEKFAAGQLAADGRRMGVGLGLYMVKLVARGHGGSVSAHDRPGGGTVFRLLLSGCGPEPAGVSAYDRGAFADVRMSAATGSAR